MLPGFQFVFVRLPDLSNSEGLEFALPVPAHPLAQDISLFFGAKEEGLIFVMGLIIGLVSMGTGCCFRNEGTGSNTWQTMKFSMLTFYQVV